MKIEVDVKKRYFFSVLAVVLIIVGIVGVFGFPKSLGGVPNPGHALSTIQGYFSGDANLESSLEKFCQSDGTNCVGGDSQTGSVSGLYDYSTCVAKNYGSNVECGTGAVAISDSGNLATGSNKIICCILKDSSLIVSSDIVVKRADCGSDRVVVGMKKYDSTARNIDYNCAKIRADKILPTQVCRLKNGGATFNEDYSRLNEFFTGNNYCLVP